MEASLAVPTATSVRTIPAKLIEVNRTILNRHLARSRGAKVSFTHLIGWAIVRALADMPGMRVSFVDRCVRELEVVLNGATDVDLHEVKREVAGCVEPSSGDTHA